jgi:TorA maturation chaperone TorD
MTMNSHCKTAGRRTKSYSLLARFFLEKVDRPLLQELASALEAAQDQGRGGSDEYFALQAATATALDSPAEMKVLQIEFARLLRGLVPDAAGADHVGVELRMLSLLCSGELEAWRSGDERNVRAMLRQELHFLDDYVTPWLPALRTRVAELTVHPFCIALIAVTAQACRRDRDDIALFIQDGVAVLPWRASRGSAGPGSAGRAPSAGPRAVY